jgi:hypothetical protein
MYQLRCHICNNPLKNMRSLSHKGLKHTTWECLDDDGDTKTHLKLHTVPSESGKLIFYSAIVFF